MKTRTCLGLVLGLPGLFALAHCSSTERDCTDPLLRDSLTCSAYRDGGATGDGGDSGEGGIIKPPDCDLTKEPKDSPACVDDGVAVFVSPTGDDATSGRKTSPVKSIAKGVELAAARGVPRVYVCEGSYDGAVDVKAPVAIFGGMSCAWAVTGARPKLAPSKGVALAVTKVSGAVLVQDLEIVGSADLGKPGDSAIAAFVSESTNVTFRNVTLTAKDGVGGAASAETRELVAPTTPAQPRTARTQAARRAGLPAPVRARIALPRPAARELRAQARDFKMDPRFLQWAVPTPGSLAFQHAPTDRSAPTELQAAQAQRQLRLAR